MNADNRHRIQWPRPFDGLRGIKRADLPREISAGITLAALAIGLGALRQVLATLTDRDVTFAITRATTPLMSVLKDDGITDRQVLVIPAVLLFS